MIRFDGITKIYRSRLKRQSVVAVQDFSLDIARGEVFGIAGPNGAGKSTLINLLLGFLHPTLGHISVDGMPPRRYVETRGVGYLSELLAIPPTWNVARTLDRYALLGGLPASERSARIAAAMDRLGLEEHRNKRVKQLSKGNLQRLGLAQALLQNSDLVILDEPTHGLDPVWTPRFRDIARELRGAGRTVLIASHNLDELERVADRVGIIDGGRLQRIAEVGTREAASSVYRLVLADAHDAVSAVFTGATAGEGIAREWLVPAMDVEALNAALPRLIAAGARIVAVMPERSRLEEAFREAIGDAT